MFTGIVESVGTITEATPAPGGKRLRLAVGSWARECPPGASIAVSGVCLTVTAASDDALHFDVIRETLERSTLGAKRPGDKFNLERSMRADGRFDGHFVAGHVDGTAVVAEVRSSTREWLLRLRPDEELLPYIIPKGSVALDGVSLTVAQLGDLDFSVALIPTTLGRTTLAALKRGDRVNVETDLVVRTIVHRMAKLEPARSLSVDTLRLAGYL